MGHYFLTIRAKLKKGLLPYYNATIWWLRRRRGDLAAIAAGRVGRCAACGKVAPMRFHREIIPPRLEELWDLTPRLAAAFARKESLICARCGAKLRGRRLALAILRHYPVPGARSLADWSRDPAMAGLRIAEINRIDGIHEALARHPGLVSSDYGSDSAPSEDLSRLSYADGTFQLILTSETLEHVPDWERALGEIRRVLVPRGRHIFTIPWRPDIPETFPRARIGEDGSVQDLAQRVCHPGGDVGYPVFTEIGRDFPERLRGLGWDVEVLFGPLTEDDVAQVFVCTKR